MKEVDPIETFFADYPPEVQAISRTLRAMVQSAMPQANELLFAKQNHVAYSFSKSRNDSICYICPLQDYTRLGFMFGTHLPDPHQMLIGEGKRLRHVKVRTSQLLSLSGEARIRTPPQFGKAREACRFGLNVRRIG